MTENDNHINLSELEPLLQVEASVTLAEVERGLRIEDVEIESKRTDILLRKRMAYWLLSLFSVNTGGALLMILLVGLGKMWLSDKVIISVLGATVLEAAAMLVTVTKYLFPPKG